MLSFLYPVFLLGAGAVAIPVLLHLLRNEQAPELRFSAVRLLRDLKVERTHRRRIRDWLLLALRAAALLILAIAFARPYLPGRQVAGGTASVIVLDRSASMRLGSAWSTARETAARQIDRAPAGEALALIAFDDRAEVIVEPTFDRSAVKAALGRLEPGLGATRYPTALARAVSLVDEVDARNARIVIVSDLQGAPADARATVPESIRFDALKVPGPTANIAVLEVRRTREGVTATLRNDGPNTARVRVRLDAGGGALSEVSADLPPSQLVEVPLRSAATGSDLRVSLGDPDPGGLTADDARYLETDAGQRARILVVSGVEDRFYIDAALRAADEASEFDIVSAAVPEAMVDLTRQALPDVVFLVGPRGFDRGGREALIRFVRGGGRVFIAASDAVNETGFASLLEGMTVSAPHADDPVLTLAGVEARHPLFQRLGPLAGAMGSATFTRAWRVRAPGWEVLARFSDGAPALLERTVGGGRVIFLASDVNRGWNDLPLQPAFVPFVHEMARYLAPERSQTAYTPGTLPQGVKPALGFVRLASGQRAVVNADPRESDTARMSAAEFSSAIRRRGDRRLDPGAAHGRAQVAEAHQSLWRYGLMLMFGTLIAEGLVGARGTRL